jgi:hypothetical protein
VTGRSSRLWRTAAACLLCACLWFCVPWPALAASAGGGLNKALADGRLTAEDAAAINAEVDKAREEGLPVSPFETKVDEGLAKGVSGPAIVRALGAMRDDYVFAREALTRNGESPAPEDVETAGESLRLGLSRKQLSELAGVQPPAPASMLATAARTWAALNAVKFPAESSAALVRRGLASGNLTPQWAQLFRVVQRARAAGIADRVVAEAAALVMGEGGGPAEVLQQLGFTGRDTRQAPGEN